MLKKLYPLLVLLILAALVLTACGGGDTEPADVVEEAVEEPVEETVDFKACQVSDTGGIDDKSFNQDAYLGVQNAIIDFGIEGKFLESQQQTDYEVNINAFIDEGCDFIITVGFLMADATEAAAAANPDIPFAIIDVGWLASENILQMNYQTDQAAFLAGYVAASVTQTGIVGTYGGIAIPSVTVFMDGFWYGVDYYNQQNGTNVEVLGWDPVVQDGLFTGNFESTDDGRSLGESLMDEGADVIMPVAGPVGLGTCAVINERGGAWMIGVDADMFVTAPECADILLTSVMKLMNTGVYTAIEAVMDGSFEGGVRVYSLEDGGVAIAPFHNADSVVSDEVKAAIEEITAGIIAGDIQVAP